MKLLRVLQERQVERLGSTQDRTTSTCASSRRTKRPLEEEIAEGRFREDLLFRINTVTIRLPALRERREDIPFLARLSCGSSARRAARRSKASTRAFSSSSTDMRGPATFASCSTSSSVRSCSPSVPGSRSRICRWPFARPRAQEGRQQEVSTLRRTVEHAEIEAIRAALGETNGRRAEAAERLGITRKTLWEKMRNYGFADRLGSG